ncbi:MAG: exosortase N [Chitinophagaceae bacterium]|nr:MAG: exosortase N [Chitinophagaceae bacterium]
MKILIKERLSAYNGKKLWPGVIAAGYMLAAIIFLRSYLFSSPLLLLLGLAGMATALPSGRPGKYYWRFGVAACVCLALYLCIPAKTFLFAAVVCALVCLVEIYRGSMPALTWFMLLFMTPVFEYACNVFSFPVRLKLTALAGRILSLADSAYLVEGNMITLGDEQFSVDPACMGLSMLTVSLLCSAIILALVQKKSTRVFHLPVLFFYFFLVVALNLVCNLLRIITLVMLKIPPESSAHDGIGLLSFALYLLVPACLAANFLSRYAKSRQEKSNDTTGNGRTGTRNLVLHVVLLGLITAAGCCISGSSLNGNVHPPDVAGYKNTRMGEKILKLESSTALVYIKPVAGFYSSDHNPMICWAGTWF